MEETWKPIPDRPGYSASTFGQIKGPKGSVLKLFQVEAHSKTYLKVWVGKRTKKGLKQSEWVHRLVCITFHGPAPMGKPHVCHVPDSDPSNNRADNLKWGSRKWNESHKNGNVKCGNCVCVYADHDEEGVCRTEKCQCAGWILNESD